MALGCLLGRGPSPKESRGARRALASEPCLWEPPALRAGWQRQVPVPPPAGSEGCCAPREEGDGDAMPGYSPPYTPSSAGEGRESVAPRAGRCQRCPHFTDGHRRGSVGTRGPAPASPAAPVRRHAQSPWRPAPLILLKMMLIFGQGQGEMLGTRVPLPAACTQPPHPPHPTGSIHTGVQWGLLRGWVSPRSGCWVIQHQCSFTQ